MRPLLVACRVAVGFVFLYAAATKVPDMAGFATDVANYRLLPAPLVPWAASVIVGLEIAAGVALVVGIGARAAALVVTLLTGAFIAALSQALLRGIDLRCGCFGGEESVTWATVARDVVLLVPAAAVLLLGPGSLRAGRRASTA